MASPVKVERSATAAEAVEKYGGYVPNYRARGEQHYRLPYKDKSRLIHVRPHPEWTKVPQHRTQTELFAKRRAARVPDISMDIDGDGVVGPTDYFVAKTFGKDNRLTTPERGRVVEALEEGFLNQYAWGYDQVGAQRKNVVKQLRGKIFNGDNAHELNHVYPPHFNAHKVPRFWTATEMKMQRKADRHNCATALKEAHESENPWHIPEPPLRQEGMVSDPPFTSRHQKDAARKREARYRGGLDECSNAEKQVKAPGLEYVEEPEVKTQRELHQHRKEQILKGLAEGEANSDFVPIEVRHTRTELEEHEARRPDPHAMTQNKLLDARKREYLEYNMRNFPHVYKQMPMFSEQEEHWWKMRKTYVAEPWISKGAKEKPLTGKVTETFFAEPEEEQDFTVAAGGSAVDVARLEHIPRWSQHFLPKGLMAKVPRHFDRLFEGADGVAEGVKKAPSLSTDTAPLDSFSSFRVIRDASRSLSNSVRDDQSEQVAKVKSTRTSAVPTRRESLDSSLPPGRTSRSNSFRRGISKDARRNSRHDLNPTMCMISAMLEDLPMTARVQRSTAGIPSAVQPVNSLPRAQELMVTARASEGRSSARGAVSPEPPSMANEPRRMEQEPLLKVRTGGFQYFDSRGDRGTATAVATSAMPGGAAGATEEKPQA